MYLDIILFEKNCNGVLMTN